MGKTEKFSEQPLYFLPIYKCCHSTYSTLIFSTKIIDTFSHFIFLIIISNINYHFYCVYYNLEQTNRSHVETSPKVFQPRFLIHPCPLFPNILLAELVVNTSDKKK